jgi:hypothetical protein
MPYRAKDFAGAANALRQAAASQRGSTAQRTLGVASQVSQLGNAYARAEGAKSSNAAAAIQAYNQAVALDQQLSHGLLVPYFKSQIGKLAGQGAQTAFAQGKYPEAYKMAVEAHDTGTLAQLHSKAAELNVRAGAMMRANPNGAKAMLRQVLQMVPRTDSAYLRATQQLSAASGAAKDEDED